MTMWEVVRVLAKSLQEYALAAEIVGAVAVVISLVYVGVSVNQNTNALMVANHQALVSMDLDTIGWLRDPEFATAWELALEDVGQLSSLQWRQVGAFVASKFNAWEFAFLTHNNEMMNDNIWDGWDGHYRWLSEQQPGRRFWREEREGFSPAFRQYVDSIQTEIE